jgi:hypothetical protein
MQQHLKLTYTPVKVVTRYVTVTDFRSGSPCDDLSQSDSIATLRETATHPRAALIQVYNTPPTATPRASLLLAAMVIVNAEPSSGSNAQAANAARGSASNLAVTTPRACSLEPLELSLSMGVIGKISFDAYVIYDPCMVCLHGLSKYCGLALLPTLGVSLRSLSQLLLGHWPRVSNFGFLRYFPYRPRSGHRDRGSV